MWEKAFHAVLITFLVIFSTAVLLFLMSGLNTFLFPRVAESNGVFAYSGGLSLPLLKVIGLLVLFTSVLIISVVARRKRLR
jgi:hypothetical protein